METITNNDIPMQHQRVHSMPVGNIYNHTESSQPSKNYILGHDQELLFGLTQIHLPIYQQDQTSLCQIELKCKVDRGFFLCDQHWTCYRRNYFQITTAFTTLNCPTNQLFYIQPPSTSSNNHNKLPIHQFYVQVIATSSDGSNKNVDLIQLTAKRDKGPQRTPPMISIHPGGGLIHHPHDTSQKTITFERLQFKSATANNGKKRASQQYYYLSIQLIAECGNNNDSTSKYILASCQSSPLVVRGRSPGHYNDNLDHKHSPYSKSSSSSSSTTLKKKQQLQKKEIPSSLSILSSSSSSSSSSSLNNNNSLDTNENDLISTPTPTILNHSSSQQQQFTSISSNNNNNNIITTPTIPSNHSPVFYTPSPHVRSYSANDTTWHLSSSSRQPYRSTNWNHFQVSSSSSSSTTNTVTSPIPTHTSSQQQHSFSWSSNDQNNHQRTQSTNTVAFNTYPTSNPDESSSPSFHHRNDFQSSFTSSNSSIHPSTSSSSLVLSSQQQQQQQPSSSISSSSSTSSSSTTSTLSQNHTPTPTTYMLYPNGPWNAIDHKPMTDFQNNEMKQ